jgi:hypothetical protein
VELRITEPSKSICHCFVLKQFASQDVIASTFGGLAYQLLKRLNFPWPEEMNSGTSNYRTLQKDLSVLCIAAVCDWRRYSINFWRACLSIAYALELSLTRRNEKWNFKWQNPPKGFVGDLYCSSLRLKKLLHQLLEGLRINCLRAWAFLDPKKWKEELRITEPSKRICQCFVLQQFASQDVIALTFGGLAYQLLTRLNFPWPEEMNSGTSNDRTLQKDLSVLCIETVCDSRCDSINFWRACLSIA